MWWTLLQDWLQDTAPIRPCSHGGLWCRKRVFSARNSASNLHNLHIPLISIGIHITLLFCTRNFLHAFLKMASRKNPEQNIEQVTSFWVSAPILQQKTHADFSAWITPRNFLPCEQPLTVLEQAEHLCDRHMTRSQQWCFSWLTRSRDLEKGEERLRYLKLYNLYLLNK